MKQKSLFNASFEESLNWEDDGFLQYHKKDVHNKVEKYLKNGKFSLFVKIQSLILTLIFPIGLNFILLAFSISLHESNPKDLSVPISKISLLTADVYLICLLVWLLLVLIGKFFRWTCILPYRYHFHVVTFLIWFMFEFNLLAITVSLPTLSIWGILSIFICIITLAYMMITFEVSSLRKLMYGDVHSPRLIDKVANKIAIYGMGSLGLTVIINFLMKGFSVKLSIFIEGLGLLLTWIIGNLALIAILIFLEFPYYLQAYYKWKYPEEYREWEGKSVEEWYGKRYLKKHKELLK